MRTWDDLSETERELMLLADEEAMLWEIPATVERRIPTPAAAVVEEAQRILGGLAREGLVWFYRLEAGNPSLTKREVMALLASSGDWLPDEETGTVSSVCIYATDHGEQLLLTG